MDWEYSEDDCPKCSRQLAWRRCQSCCGEGLIEHYDTELDDSRDEICYVCNGDGDEEWCRECGWDVNYNRFLSPQYEAAFLAKQVTETGKS